MLMAGDHGIWGSLYRTAVVMLLPGVQRCTEHDVLVIRLMPSSGRGRSTAGTCSTAQKRTGVEIILEVISCFQRHDLGTLGANASIGFEISKVN